MVRARRCQLRSNGFRAELRRAFALWSLPRLGETVGRVVLLRELRTVGRNFRTGKTEIPGDHREMEGSRRTQADGQGIGARAGRGESRPGIARGRVWCQN